MFYNTDVSFKYQRSKKITALKKRKNMDFFGFVKWFFIITFFLCLIYGPNGAYDLLAEVSDMIIQAVKIDIDIFSRTIKSVLPALASNNTVAGSLVLAAAIFCFYKAAKK